MPHRHTPHHVAKKLKKTLVVATGGGVIALVLLSLLIATFTSHITSELAQTQQTALLGADQILKEQQVLALPDNTSNIPTQLDKKTLVEVVAKNQPAVVRILTVYCTDVVLTSGSLSFSESDACSAGVGSGSIISSDGYIATNGHVVATSPTRALLNSLSTNDKIQAYLNYLVGTGVLPGATATTILKANVNNSEGASELLDQTASLIPASSVAAKNTDVYYAVQLGNEPVRLKTVDERVAVDFTDTIIPASLVDQDFDQATADQSLQTGQFTSSDVALLKAVGSFPYVRLGDSNSVTVGDQLTAIGFPAFIDNSVNTDKWQTVPSITQGKVTAVASDARVNGRKIIDTSVPIAQGSSGGPAFNNAGEQIGLNTYTALECEDSACFGDGVVRDVADLTALLNKHNITLQMGGVTTDWYQGLDAYVSGNYSEALAAFKKVQDAYSPNYLVSPFARLARQQLGSSTDTSSSFQARTVTVTILVVIGICVFVLAVLIMILIIYFTHKHRREIAL